MGFAANHVEFAANHVEFAAHFVMFAANCSRFTASCCGFAADYVVFAACVVCENTEPAEWEQCASCCVNLCSGTNRLFVQQHGALSFALGREHHQTASGRADATPQKKKSGGEIELCQKKILADLFSQCQFRDEHIISKRLG